MLSPMSFSLSKVVQDSGRTGTEQYVGRFATLAEIETQFGIELRSLGGDEYTGTDVGAGVIYIVKEQN